MHRLAQSPGFARSVKAVAGVAGLRQQWDARVGWPGMSTSESRRDAFATVLDTFDRVARGRFAPYLALLALTLAIYLPGVIRIPAVDRTEIVFAETTRDMVARGAWADPRYGEAVHPFRPIGTFWAQGLSASIAGPAHARDISIYRLPSLIAVGLSVLAMFWLAAPRVGRHTALIAAGLFAVAPLTVLVSQLSIADGLALLPATVAMLCLMRLYDPEAAQLERPLALLFWVAMGLGMLVNALHTPILVGVTVLALLAFDRDLTWLRRTRPLVGIPIALVLAAPWLYVRFQQDGIPFTGLGWMEFLAALGGAQDMKLRAFPGTFVAAALLGFLPGVALLPPALKSLWDDRAHRLPRFLLAWVIGYIVYLELFSSKPGTYTVQVLFPALAIAVAILVTQAKPDSPAPRWSLMGSSLIPWPPAAALFALSLFAGVYAFTREIPSLAAALLIAAVALLFAASAHLGRSRDLIGWALVGIASLALFAITLLGVVFPGVQHIWPAREIARAAAMCAPGPVSIIGFREPSAAFVVGAPKAAPSPDTIPLDAAALHVIESRWIERYRAAVTARGGAVPVEIGCIDAFNVMRGCPVTFTVLAPDPKARGCTPDPRFSCKGLKTLVRPSSRGCD